MENRVQVVLANIVISLTFELHDITTSTLGKTFLTCIAGQRHGNSTATQQETNLLTTSIL